MPKSFLEAFNEWKKERYKIGDDIGWEFADSQETGGPTPLTRSSTPDHGTTHPAQEIVDPGEET